MALLCVDLFCGCGGMSWGLRQAGFRVLAGIDNWAPALNTFKLNHPEAAAINADLAVADPRIIRVQLGLAVGELDCLVGGPPCQGFSKNVPASYRFLDDPRNQLFRSFLRFVEEFYPKTVVMENVAEIYNAFGGQVRDEIVQSLEALGYDVQVRILLAAEYGVPQLRRRCFFFASRTGVAPQFPLPSFAPKAYSSLLGNVQQYRSAWSAISDLPVLHHGEGFEPMPYDREPENDFQREMRKNSEVLYDHIARKLTPIQLARISAIGPGEGINELPDHLRPKTGYSGAYGRLNYDDPAPTITRWVFHPGSGRFSHPREPRVITIREAARLQSFSDDFRFTGTYIEKAHQVGNAVPPLLMATLADSIKACVLTPLSQSRSGR